MKKQLLTVLLMTSILSFGQKVTIESGDFKSLKGISEFNLSFDYSNLKVDKWDNEDDFLADKMKKREEKGTDQDFKKSWFSDRQTRYEPKFVESFNKRFENGEVKVGKALDTSKYLLIVKTSWIYPGYNVGVMRQPAKIDANITITEVANPSHILLSVSYEKALGNGAGGFDYNSGYRISEAYAKLAKEFAAELKKKTK